MILRCSDIMKRNPNDDYCTQCLHGVVVFALFCAEKWKSDDCSTVVDFAKLARIIQVDR